LQLCSTQGFGGVFGSCDGLVCRSKNCDKTAARSDPQASKNKGSGWTPARAIGWICVLG